MVRQLLAAALLLASCARAPRELDVAAAISLKDALTDVARGWEARGGERVVFNFAGSNVLARQVRAGAPVDVFLPADMRTAESFRDSASRGRCCACAATSSSWPPSGPAARTPSG